MFFRWLQDLRQRVSTGKQGSRVRAGRKKGLARPLGVEALEERTVPSTVSWINPAGGDWSTASDWSTGAVPGAGDDAVINQPGNVTVTHAANATDTVHSLTNSAALTVAAGILNAETVLNTGTVTVAGLLAVNNYTQTGGKTLLQGGSLGSFLPPESTALSFNGSDFVQTPSSARLNPTSQLSVEAWVKPAALDNPLQGIAGTWNDLSGNNRTNLLWIQFSKFAFYVSHNGSDYPNVVSNTTLQANHWYHVAGTFDGTYLRLYVNGALEAVTYSPGSVNPNSLPFNIGRVDGGGSTPRDFQGQIADLSFWNVARSQSDVQADMRHGPSATQTGLAGYWPLNAVNNGTVIDQSSGQNNGTTSTPLLVATPVTGGTVRIQGGTLSGAGTVNGDLTNAGAVDLGSAAGVLTIRGNYTQTTAGATALKVGGAAGAQFDQMDVAGSATLNGTLNVSLSNGFNPLHAQTFAVLNFASVSGNFAAVNLPTADGVTAFTTNLAATNLTLVGATVAPTSTVNPLPANSPPTFTVSWTGQDNPGGSGVAGYDVYVSDNGGAFVRFLAGTVTTSATFSGQRGHGYGFYSVATDAIGNREATPSAAEATTAVPLQVSTTTTLATSAGTGSGYGQSVTFTATVSPNLGVLGTPTGSVQFLVDGVNFGSPVNLAGGAASITTSALSAGAHGITANFTSNTSDFGGSSGGPLGQNVSPATLTVTADDVSKAFGTDNPPLTDTITGFVNGDSAGVVSGTADLSTTADASSAVGAYTITAGPGTLSAANYTFTFVNGTLTVTQNTDPLMLVSSADASVYAQPVTFTATAAAASGASTPTGTITFMDGTTTLATVDLVDGTASYTSAALERGSHLIQAVYSGDPNFAAGASATLAQKVQTVVLEPDPLDPGKTALFVGGTSGNDRIEIESERHGKRIEVEIHEKGPGHFHFEKTFKADGIDRIVVYGGPGNDHIKVSDGVKLPTLLFGGDGDNVLEGGSGPTVIVGGTGHNKLVGGSGRNILIGGAGSGVLVAHGTGSLLIGGTTDFDTNVAALSALLAEWSRKGESYEARVNHLLGPDAGGTSGGANGCYFLNATTVDGSGTEDTLVGSHARDWFIVGDHDRVKHRRHGEVTTFV